jgi:hypothetical protein
MTSADFLPHYCFFGLRCNQHPLTMSEGTGTTEKGDTIGDVTTRLLKDDEGDFDHEIDRPGLSTMILTHSEDMNNLNP